MKVFTDRFERINSESILDFFNQLELAYPNASNIHVILDQAGYHRSESVKQYLARSKIKVEYLPAYSPNLNPIERLWKVMNEQVRNNRCFSSAKEFKDSIEEFFGRTFPKIGESFRGRINDNFQIINAIN